MRQEPDSGSSISRQGDAEWVATFKESVRHIGSISDPWERKATLDEALTELALHYRSEITRVVFGLSRELGEPQTRETLLEILENLRILLPTLVEAESSDLLPEVLKICFATSILYSREHAG